MITAELAAMLVGTNSSTIWNGSRRVGYIPRKRRLEKRSFVSSLFRRLSDKELPPRITFRRERDLCIELRAVRLVSLNLTVNER